MTVAEYLNGARPALERLARKSQLHRQHQQLEQESNWLAANRHRYAGRWIALEGDQLLAVGLTSKEVFVSVANHLPAPLVMQIVEDELPFAGW